MNNELLPVLIPVQKTKKFQLLEFFDIEFKVTELLYIKTNEYPLDGKWTLPLSSKNSKNLEDNGIYKKINIQNQISYSEELKAYIAEVCSDDILNACKATSHVVSFDIDGVKKLPSTKHKQMTEKFIHEQNLIAFQKIISYMALSSEESLALKNEMIQNGYLVK